MQLKNGVKKNLFSIACMTMAMSVLEGIQQSSWVTTNGDWNTAVNWDPAIVPNGSGDKALFNFQTVPFTVTSATDVTLDFLFLNSSSATFQFGSNKFIFDGPTTGKMGANVGMHQIDNEISFVIPTTIQADGFGQRWVVTGPLTSGGPLASIGLTTNSAQPDDFSVAWLHPGLIVSANNSLAPSVTISSGCLALDSAINGVPVAPKNIMIMGDARLVPGQIGGVHGGVLRTIQGVDLFPHDAVITCLGGHFSVTGGALSGPAAATNQTVGQLILQGGVVSDTQNGNFNSESVFSTLTLTSTQPIKIGGNGRISVGTIILENGGTIAYDNTVPGKGFISNFGAAADFLPYQLYLTPIGQMPQNTVTLEVVSLSSGGDMPFDISFKNIAILDGGLTKTGLGTVLFEGKSGSLPMTFTISGGTATMGLNIGDKIASQGLIVVNNSAVLNGHGTVGGSGCAVRNDQGLVRPGDANTIGQLTIDGDYFQNVSGTLQIRAIGIADNQHDLLVVNGHAVFQNDTTIQLLAFDGGDYPLQSRIPIVKAGPNPGTEPGFLFADATSLNAMFLEQTPYHIDAELVVDAATSTLYIQFNPAPSLTSLATDSGALEMASEETLFVIERQSDMHSRIRSGGVVKRDELDARDLLVAAENQKNPFMTGARFKRGYLENPWSVYVAPLGSKGMLKRIDSQNGLGFHSLGAVVGGDYTFKKIGVGANLAYEKFRAQVHEGWGHFSVQNIFGRLYATILPFKNDNFFIDASLGVGTNLTDIHRNVRPFVAHGKTRGWTFNAYGQVGYDFLWDNWRITPLASINYDYYVVEDYMEHGAGQFNVLVGHQNITSLLPSLGLNIGGSWKTGKVTWLPEARVSWEKECCDINHKVKVTSLVFDTQSMVPVLGGNRNFYMVGGGLRTLFGSYWSLYGSYDFSWSTALRNNIFYGELRINF